jgi:hypothetical protein
VLAIVAGVITASALAASRRDFAAIEALLAKGAKIDARGRKWRKVLVRSIRAA